MIKFLVSAFERGMLIMRTNTRMLLVGVLIFVFPLLFVWITQSFFETSFNNIKTLEAKRLGTLNDSLTVILSNRFEDKDLISLTIDDLAKENPDFVDINILEESEEGYEIIFSNSLPKIGQTQPIHEHFDKIGFTDTRDFNQMFFIVNNARISQNLKRVSVGDEYVYIYTQQDFSTTDKILSHRRQLSYFGLTAIFVFLISLAYWLNRQVHWKKEHQVLTQQLHERDLFSNMIAHEFRSPLTAIKGYASFLQDSKSLTEDEVRFAGNIHASAERLVLLVSDFLEVARLQSGKLKIEKSEIDMRGILEQISQDLSGMATKKNLRLIYTKTKKPILLNTDNDRMIQVLTNIISNAIKYTDKGDVELECSKTTTEVTVKVKDTGMGISAEDQKKLFAPFTRVGGVDNSSVTGTGLGMWITKQLVELLGGSIGVESIKGVGTHIVIKFKT